MAKVRVLFSLIRETFSEWRADNVSHLAAALAFYTVFSLAPVLIILIAMASYVFGEDAARGEIVAQFRGVVGAEGAKIIQTVLAAGRGGSSTATVIGVGTVLFGATVIFVALQEALNSIWGITPKPGSQVKYFIEKRLLSFSIVVGIGFLLLLFLLLSTMASTAAAFLINPMPVPAIVLGTANFLLSFAIITVLIAVIYKVLPDVKIAWSDVWMGAAATALLLTVGKGLIGMYLVRATVGSAYGAAGSFVILLVWVYYSAQVFFLGAEFTQVYARRYGSQIVPARHAAPPAEARSTEPEREEEPPANRAVAAPPGGGRP